MSDIGKLTAHNRSRWALLGVWWTRGSRASIIRFRISAWQEKDKDDCEWNALSLLNSMNCQYDDRISNGQKSQSGFIELHVIMQNEQRVSYICFTPRGRSHDQNNQPSRAEHIDATTWMPWVQQHLRLSSWTFTSTHLRIQKLCIIP